MKPFAGLGMVVMKMVMKPGDVVIDRRTEWLTEKGKDGWWSCLVRDSGVSKVVVTEGDCIKGCRVR